MKTPLPEFFFILIIGITAGFGLGVLAMDKKREMDKKRHEFKIEDTRKTHTTA